VRIHHLHAWDLSPTQAIETQRQLRERACLQGDPGTPRLVAGADCSWDRAEERGWAGVIVFEFPSLDEVERVGVQGPVVFPYVPGLLSFREAPLLLEAFAKLRHETDLIFFDGQGYAHPRRMGIATHMGLVLDKPTIGCAKSRLVGEHREPGPKRGHRAQLLDGGERIGVALRTRDGVRPIYLSAGHRISLDAAIRLTLRCSDGYRIPKPTRLADHFVGQLRRDYLAARPSTPRQP
jgi:deoxyribonuclease V